MGKFIDREGRLFGKISVIDLLVVLAVLVLAAALYAKNNTLEPTATTQTDTPITFTLLAENLSFQAADAVRVGDKVFDKERSSGGALGEITAIEELPGEKTEHLSSGVYVRLPNADGKNLLITVEGSGSVINGRYAINRVYELGVNAARTFYTPYVSFIGSVTDIH